jgi:gliding motility-associated-like protein
VLRTLCVSFTLAFLNVAWGQLAVTDTFSATNISNLAETLVGSGVQIFNVQYQCDDKGLGTFNGSSSNIGINQGIVLTSGYAATAIGPNDMPGSGNDLSRPGDPQINQIISPNISQDACVLEFDFIPDGDTIKFNYVFASEEYPEFVNAGFNDAFAFFINGPGVPLQNIAYIPNTNIPVTIDNLNNGSANAGPCQNCTYYVNNGEGMTPNINTSIQYDGFTTVLEAKIAVNPCDTYHLKMAVSDVGDGSLDSGVFIEKGSLSSRDVQLSSKVNSSFFKSVVEDCLNGSFEFIRRGDITDSLELAFSIGGTATNGVDYDSIGSSVMFLPNDSSAIININVISDSISDDNEEIKIYLIATCTGLPYDSSVLTIKEPFTPDVFLTDKDLCFGDSILLNNIEDSVFAYLWSPTYMLDCDTCAKATSKTDSTIKYILDVYHIPGCEFSDTMTVNVFDIPVVDLGPDTSFCFGQNITLNSSGDPLYAWSWNNPNGLSCTNCVSPVASPSGNNFYIAKAQVAQCEAYDSIFLTILPLPNTNAGSNQSICLNDSIQLNGSGADSLKWSPSTFLNDANNAASWSHPTQNITYYLLGIDTTNGCQKSDSVIITVNPLPIANAGIDTSLCSDSIISIGVSTTNGLQYSWSPTDYLNAANISNPEFSLSYSNDTSLKYNLTVINAFGCIALDSVIIEVHPNPIASAGNDTTILAGSYLALDGKGGDTYLWAPSAGLDDTTDPNTIAAPTASTIYNLIVSTIHACKNIDDILITVLESAVVMPSGFSPNGDGENDMIGALGLPLIDFTLMIFDRWGAKVFETNNVTQHWDGKYNNKDQPAGTYVYFIKGSYNNEPIFLKGNFALIR